MYLYKWCVHVCDVVCVYLYKWWYVCVCVCVHHVTCVYLWKYVHGMCAVYGHVYVSVWCNYAHVWCLLYIRKLVLKIIHMTVVLKNPDELNYLQSY